MNILGLKHLATKQVRVLVDLYGYLAQQRPDTPESLQLWELEKRFGVSRPTMRKVVQRLEAHGLITVERTARSTRITGWLPLSDRRWRDFIEAAFSEDALDLYQNRRPQRKITKYERRRAKREMRVLRCYLENESVSEGDAV